MNRLFVWILLITVGLSSGSVFGFAKEEGSVRPGLPDGYFYSTPVQGLVGNSQLKVITLPGSFVFEGKKLINKGKVSVITLGRIKPLDTIKAKSFLSPGEVEYDCAIDGFEILIQQTVDWFKNLYVYGIRFTNTLKCKRKITAVFQIDIGKQPFELNSQSLKIDDTSRVNFNILPTTSSVSQGIVKLKFDLEIAPRGQESIIANISENLQYLSASAQPLQDVSNYYQTKGVILHSPDKELNKAVNFLNAQLRIENPDSIVSSRQIGEGLIEGLLANGRFSDARRVLYQHLKKYQDSPAAHYKIDCDCLRGGSAAGIGWILISSWQYYLRSGDQEFLRDLYKIMKPWIEIWLLRDYDCSGLVVDTADWMTHSRFYLVAHKGIRTLYSNVVYYQLLHIANKITVALGEKGEAANFLKLATRTRDKINSLLWNEKGYYDNYILWGINDDRLCQPANVLAILFGIPQPTIPLSRTILNNIQLRNWGKWGVTNVNPPLENVNKDNLENSKIWTHWEAKESLVRFLTGDTEGGLKVLKWAMQCLNSQPFPGFTKPVCDPADGKPLLKDTFLPAAGAILHTIVNGLVGFEILAPGEVSISLSPGIPLGWKEFQTIIPLVEGELEYKRKFGQIAIRVKSSRVKHLRTLLPFPFSLSQIKVNTDPIHPVLSDHQRGTWIDIDLTPGENRIEIEYKIGKSRPKAQLTRPSVSWEIKNTDLFCSCTSGKFCGFVGQKYRITIQVKNLISGSGDCQIQLEVPWVDSLPKQFMLVPGEEKLVSLDLIASRAGEFDGKLVVFFGRQTKRKNVCFEFHNFTRSHKEEKEKYFLDIEADEGLVVQPLFAGQAKIAIFEEKGLDSYNQIYYLGLKNILDSQGYESFRLSSEDLINLDKIKIECLIYLGNKFPFATKDGVEIFPYLYNWLKNGGNLLLLGADHNFPAFLSYDSATAAWRFFDPQRKEFRSEPKNPGKNYWGEGPYFGTPGLKLGIDGKGKELKGVTFAASGFLAKFGEQPINLTGFFNDTAIGRGSGFEPLAFAAAEDGTKYPVIPLIKVDNWGQILIIPLEIFESNISDRLISHCVKNLVHQKLLGADHAYRWEIPWGTTIPVRIIKKDYRIEVQ